MKNYIKPELERVAFQGKDIITLSDGTSGYAMRGSWKDFMKDIEVDE